jgi:hypothetical protein
VLSSVCLCLDTLLTVVVVAVSELRTDHQSYLQQAAETEQADIEGYNQQQIADGVLPAGANHQGISTLLKQRVQQLIAVQRRSHEAMGSRRSPPVEVVVPDAPPSVSSPPDWCRLSDLYMRARTAAQRTDRLSGICWLRSMGSDVQHFSMATA